MESVYNTNKKDPVDTLDNLYLVQTYLQIIYLWLIAVQCCSIEGPRKMVSFQEQTYPWKFLKSRKLIKYFEF